MSTNDVQLWKSSAFTIEHCPEEDPNAVRFCLSGPFTARDMYSKISPAAFRSIFDLWPSCEQQCNHVIDLTRVPYMDSMGLGMIVSHFVGCQNRGIQLTIIGASPRVLELFRISKVDGLLPIGSA